MTLSRLATDTVRQRQSTPTAVARVLRQAILEGVLKDGQALPQDELAAQFGLSRIPIREALRQLEGEGLVSVQPHRGAVVSSLSRDELQEMCDIRLALESLALRLAIARMDTETLAQACTILVRIDDEQDVATHWSAYNWQFHSTLYAPAQRPRLLALIKSTHDNVDRYLRMHVSLLNYKAQGQIEHWNLLEACRRRDATAALGILDEHIAGVALLLGTYLQPDKQPAGGSQDD